MIGANIYIKRRLIRPSSCACVPWLYSVDPPPPGSYYGLLDKRKAAFGLMKARSVLTEEQMTCRLGANTVATHPERGRIAQWADNAAHAISC